MLDHFLAVGGNEVINSARAYGYATTSGCPTWWLEDPECPTIAEAESATPYVYANITQAPWYDPDDASATGRFLGLYGIDILGLSDSTREAQVTQLTGDGAATSGYRHASREVRVRAWMSAIGQDALEAGMTWLRNVLEPNACGQHGGTCGSADAAFFVDCPPPRRITDVPTDWTVERTNLVTNPRVQTGTTGYSDSGTFASGGSRRIPFPAVPDDHLDWSYGATDNTVASNNKSIRYYLGELAAGTYRVGYWAKASGTGAMSARVSELATLAADVIDSNPLTLNDQWAWQSFQFTLASASDVYVGIFGASGAVTNADADMTGVILIAGSGPDLLSSDYFDGALPDDPALIPLYQYAWTGAADASTSAYDTRSLILGPETDATYQPYVDEWRRFLHSVRCISGPFAVEERQSGDKRHYGRLVEFTLVSEVPWVYGIPKEIEVPPMVPTIMQDIAFNLAPYPSAELAGAAMIASTNYFVNPSVETNSSNWARIAGTGVLDANLVASRVTGELAAVGTASYRTVFTATNSGTNGYFGNNQSSPTAIPTAAGTRVSFSAWSACVVMSGSPVLGNITFYAFWTNASNSVIGNTYLGAVPYAGGAVTLKSVVPLAGSTGVIIEARCNLTSWSSGNVVRLYSDAFAVTVP